MLKRIPIEYKKDRNCKIEFKEAIRKANSYLGYHRLSAADKDEVMNWLLEAHKIAIDKFGNRANSNDYYYYPCPLLPFRRRYIITSGRSNSHMIKVFNNNLEELQVLLWILPKIRAIYNQESTNGE